MYVHDLTMHMIELQKDNTPFLARRYSSLADEYPRKMFMVVVPNPYNGNCIIIHSASVADPKQEALFLPLEVHDDFGYTPWSRYYLKSAGLVVVFII